MSDNGWNELMERDKRKSRPADGKVVSLFPEMDDRALLPGEHTDYQAAGMPANKGLVRFCCILGKGEFREGGNPYRFFQYVHLGANAEFGYEKGGQVMRFHFTGMTPLMVTVRGRNLLQTCDYIQMHRIHWIRQADRDFTPDEALGADGNPLPFISQIEITACKLLAGR